MWFSGFSSFFFCIYFGGYNPFILYQRDICLVYRKKFNWSGRQTCAYLLLIRTKLLSLLIKIIHNKEIFKKYRPVSNLNFISKILERVIDAVQLQTHLDEASLMTAFQSAYRKHHSTESALLNIQNNLLLNMAKGSVTALPYWISLPPSIPLTTPFSLTDLMFTMESVN